MELYHTIIIISSLLGTTTPINALLKGWSIPSLRDTGCVLIPYRGQRIDLSMQAVQCFGAVLRIILRLLEFIPRIILVFFLVCRLHNCIILQSSEVELHFVLNLCHDY